MGLYRKSWADLTGRHLEEWGASSHCAKRQHLEQMAGLVGRDCGSSSIPSLQPGAMSSIYIIDIQSPTWQWGSDSWSRWNSPPVKRRMGMFNHWRDRKLPADLTHWFNHSCFCFTTSINSFFCANYRWMRSFWAFTLPHWGSATSSAIPNVCSMWRTVQTCLLKLRQTLMLSYRY